MDPITLTLLLLGGGALLIGGTVASSPQLRDRTFTLTKMGIGSIQNRLMGISPIAAIEADYQRAEANLLTMKQKTGEIVAQRKAAERDLQAADKVIADNTHLFADLSRKKVKLQNQLASLQNAGADEAAIKAVELQLASNATHITTVLSNIQNKEDERATGQRNVTEFKASEKRRIEQIQEKELELEQLQSAKRRAEAHVSRAEVAKADAEFNRIASSTTSDFNDNVRKLEMKADAADAYAELTGGSASDLELKRLERSSKLASLEARLNSELGIVDNSHLLAGPKPDVLRIETKEPAAIEANEQSTGQP